MLCKNTVPSKCLIFRCIIWCLPSFLASRTWRIPYTLSFPPSSELSWCTLSYPPWETSSCRSHNPSWPEVRTSYNPESINQLTRIIFENIFSLRLLLTAFGQNTYLNWSKGQFRLLTLGTFHALLLAFLGQGLLDTFWGVLLWELLHADLTILLDQSCAFLTILKVSINWQE